MGSTMKITPSELEKLQDAVYWVCKIAQSKGLKLFSIPLSKIIFLADRRCYLRNLKPMIADAYVHGKNGPYLESLRTAISNLKSEGYIRTERRKYGIHSKTEYYLGCRSDRYQINNISKNNLEELREITFDVLVNETAETVSGFTHNHAWQVSVEKEHIPMCAQLITQPAEITDEDVEWAKSTVAHM